MADATCPRCEYQFSPDLSGECMCCGCGPSSFIGATWLIDACICPDCLVRVVRDADLRLHPRLLAELQAALDEARGG